MESIEPNKTAFLSLCVGSYNCELNDKSYCADTHIHLSDYLFI